jgi:FkbM family methyltransferase
MIKFVQVGAHIGQNDFASTITKTSNIEFGLLIEPLPQLLPYLKESYKDVPNIIIENKAVTVEGSKKLTFYVDTNDSITELSSLNKQHLLDHKIDEKDIQEIIVQGEKLETILDNYNIKELDWLFVDVEGYDCDILLDFNLSKYKINSIVFEYTHSDGAFSKGGPKLNKLIDKLISLNYQISELDHGNLLCELKPKLNIIYRGCNLENPNEPSRPGRPKGFSKIDCFYTLHRAIKNYNNVNKVYIIIDGDKGYLSDYIESLGYKIIYIDAKSNEKSLKYCYELASSIDDDNNIYFVEDDYWHTENALSVINEGIINFGLTTGYDHTDRYTRTDDISYGKEYIKLSENHYWRTAESTTCTWAVSRTLYNKINDVAKEELLNDRNFFRKLYSRNIKLHTPIPSVSTHVMEGYISPFFKFS